MLLNFSVPKIMNVRNKLERLSLGSLSSLFRWAPALLVNIPLGWKAFLGYKLWFNANIHKAHPLKVL
jgi:hypothetical protein